MQVNAYNFPVWGMLEKLAPALLAGVPSVVKPAAQTAYVTERVRAQIAESGLLPEGALQLLVGGTDGLLDGLGGQDLLSFTGSAATGRRAARAPGRGRAQRPLQRRGRLAERCGARPRRQAGHARSSTCSCARSCAR